MAKIAFHRELVSILLFKIHHWDVRIFLLAFERGFLPADIGVVVDFTPAPIWARQWRSEWKYAVKIHS